jgi:hypothetical protein
LFSFGIRLASAFVKNPAKLVRELACLGLIIWANQMVIWASKYGDPPRIIALPTSGGGLTVRAASNHAGN